MSFTNTEGTDVLPSDFNSQYLPDREQTTMENTPVGQNPTQMRWPQTRWGHPQGVPLPTIPSGPRNPENNAQNMSNFFNPSNSRPTDWGNNQNPHNHVLNFPPNSLVPHSSSFFVPQGSSVAGVHNSVAPSYFNNFNNGNQHGPSMYSGQVLGHPAMYANGFIPQGRHNPHVANQALSLSSRGSTARSTMPCRHVNAYHPYDTGKWRPTRSRTTSTSSVRSSEPPVPTASSTSRNGSGSKHCDHSNTHFLFSTVCKLCGVDPLKKHLLEEHAAELGLQEEEETPRKAKAKGKARAKMGGRAATVGLNLNRMGSGPGPGDQNTFRGNGHLLYNEDGINPNFRFPSGPSYGPGPGCKREEEGEEEEEEEEEKGGEEEEGEEEEEEEEEEEYIN